MQKRIYYDSTDTGGIVYHTEYIKFCEQARSEIFFSKNIFLENEGYVVNTLNANYIKSAKLGDIISIKTYITEIKRVSLKVHQEIFKKDEKIFEINLNLAFIKNGKITRIPQKHLEIFNEYQK